MKRSWLKHAFAIEKPEDFAPTAEQERIAGKLCRWFAKRGLTTPAIMFIESSRGLNYIGANALHFFRPMVAALLDTREYEQFATMLEHRGSMDYLCRLLERFEKEFTTENSESTGDGLNTDEHR